MNCMRFQKYAAAFADGELDVVQNLEALEHVNMCPRCATRVSGIQRLKSVLQRIWPAHTAPVVLKDRVVSAITATVVEPVASESSHAPDPQARGSADRPKPVRAAVGRFRLYVPLAAAAALFLVVALWQFQSIDDWKRGTSTPLARAVADVGEQHMQCVSHYGLKHHDKSLGRDLATVAEVLGQRLDMPVLVPDLWAHGFEFVGADKCGIRGRTGAHVFYHSPTRGLMVSLFTVNRIAALETCNTRRLQGRDFFVASGEDVCVVGWHTNRYSYVGCAGGSETEDLPLTLFCDVRTADTSPAAFSGVLLAQRMVGEIN